MIFCCPFDTKNVSTGTIYVLKDENRMVGLIVVSTYDFALCMHKLASVGFL
jgi:hypothetical protein